MDDRQQLDFAAVRPLLACPTCKGPLATAAPTDAWLKCAAPACGKTFPVCHGKPVLLDEARSVFDHASYHAPPSAAARPTRLGEFVRQLPSPSVKLSATRSFETMRDQLLASSPAPVVLIVGGGINGKGMQVLAACPALRLINVDPSPGSSAVLFCDGHDLPFADGSIDGVVVQAVLEHVADPQRCVDEIYRVLRPGGLVYSETPFMQQVHLHGYDFTRFTHLGHRRLFRWFTEVESGVVAGPGTALAWSWRYFLAAVAPPRWQKLATGFGRVTGFALEQVDHLVKQRAGAIDAASCTYFLGARADAPVSDRDVLAGYRGQQ